ncbi:MAG: hypothetical protein U1E70_21950 [Acetobacteraceae bacterium]|nr:hypothetical protein [Pseudomonadota bacterium]
MRTIMAALLLVGLASSAQAATCGQTANRAGCVGPNGAATYNKNTGAVRTGRTYPPPAVAPGAHVQGARGNSATKALAPGCAYVNGQRVCN